MSRKRRLTGEAAKKAAFEAVDHAPLLDKLGVELPGESLKLALTHRSFANGNGMLTNNERLEFLGDAVLGVCVAEELYRRFSDCVEQGVSKMRTGVVNMYTLVDLACSIGLGEHILLGHGEKATGGVDKHSILADTTEALLGAIYLQHGFEVARETVPRLFSQMIDDAPMELRGRDRKTLLQECLAAKQLLTAEHIVRTTGPDHDLTFYVDVLVDGVVKGSGTGTTKKEVEMYTARQAHAALA